MPWEFVSAALLLSLLALAFALFPLLRSGPGPVKHRSRLDMNRQIHRERLEELAQDLANGTLSREQYDEAVADLERELVESGAVRPDHEGGSRGGSWLVSAAALGSAVVALPAAVLLYGLVGNADALNPGVSMQEARQQAASAPQSREDIERLAEQLHAHLRENPEDTEGWTMLGRTYVHLQRFEDASDAFGEAVDRGRADPDTLAEYAASLGSAHGTLRGKPQELVERALHMDPDHLQARWLAGTAALDTADYDTAREHFEYVLAQLPPDSENAGLVRSQLRAIEDQAGP